MAIDEDDPLAEGSTVTGRYRIVRRIRDGAFATVYEAVDTANGNTRALKVLAPRYAKDPELLDRFRVEGLVQMRLEHAGIIRVHEVLHDPKALVMDYAAGGDLADWLEQTNDLPELDDVMRIMHQLLNALEFAHDRGVIHRDLKPSNVVFGVAPGIEGLMPRLTDFGIVKIAEGSGLARVAAPTENTRLGTPAYMSPEQYRTESIDARSDLFSLGAILYELLTKRRAFETPRALLDGELEPPEMIVPSLHPALAVCVRKALAHEPADRFQSCVEFRAALEEAVAPRAIRLPAPRRVQQPPLPPPPPDPLPPDPSSAPSTAAMYAALGILGIGGAGQLYNGQVAKGTLLFAAHAAMIALCYHSAWTLLPWAVLGSTALGALDAWRVASRRRVVSIDRWTWL